MQEVDIHLIHGATEREVVFQIRRRVFIHELQVPLDLEFDGLDDQSAHFIMYHKQKPIGCARIRTTEEGAKLERIALLKPYRGKGFGRYLMNYLIDYCTQHHERSLYLYSQINARGFYEKCGFISTGNPFFEAGLKHIKMYRIIEK